MNVLMTILRIAPLLTQALEALLDTFDEIDLGDDYTEQELLDQVELLKGRVDTARDSFRQKVAERRARKTLG